MPLILRQTIRPALPSRLLRCPKAPCWKWKPSALSEDFISLRFSGSGIGVKRPGPLAVPDQYSEGSGSFCRSGSVPTHPGLDGMRAPICRRYGSGNLTESFYSCFSAAHCPAETAPIPCKGLRRKDALDMTLLPGKTDRWRPCALPRCRMRLIIEAPYDQNRFPERNVSFQMPPAYHIKR